MITRNNCLSCFISTVILASLAGHIVARESSIVHSSFEDFAAGTFPDGGTNAYVTASGEIQMINRLDLNNDGYIDILVGQGHNHIDNEDILLYWGSPEGPKSMMPPLPEHQPLGKIIRELRLRAKGLTRLPSDGGGRSLVIDLNGDDLLDIVFCNFFHNFSEHVDAMIYWGTRNGFDQNRSTRLPTLMGCAVAAADFNKDGYIDLAFANNGLERNKEFGLTQHLESYIYWNGPLGFDKTHRTSLPTISATDCAAGDLDGDGYPELLFVNNNADEKSVYLYWGSAKGFSKKRRDSWSSGNPLGANLVDIDKDGKLDLVLTHGDNRVQILRGTGKGFEQEPLAELATVEAIESEAADLNKDGFVDLVLANKGSKEKKVSYIYWGGDQGFFADKRLELPTLGARDVSLADFNNDGWLDVCFANERDDKTYDVNSYIYWNSPQGFDAACRSDLQGFGTVDATAADIDMDGNQDVLLISGKSGKRKKQASPGSFIYWGNPRHYYSVASMSVVPTSADTQAVADLDNNGYVDIVFPNGDLYWGGPEGFSLEQREKLGIKGNGVSVGDLNRDGYLDLLIPVSKERYTGKLQSKGVILWGSAEGYNKENKAEIEIKAQYCQSANIADLNKDGFVDLIFADVFSPNINFFWGDETGTYSPDRRSDIELHSASTIEFADLNTDGWLDLCIGAVYDPEKFGRPMRLLTLLWGGPKGYSPSRSSSLEAYESEEQAIADLNKDGYLDIVATNYHGYTTRSLPFFIYWGNKDAAYSESNRTQLPGESSLAVTLADLNKDSWIDLVISNHQDHGDHTAGTTIFWGGSEGYSYERSHWLQTFGSHFSHRRDIGDIYYRRLQEEYVSAPLQCQPGHGPSQLIWKAQTPHGTGLKFQIRSAKSAGILEKAVWQGATGPGSYYEQSGTELSVPSSHRWIQYRAVLTTPDGGNTPILEEVRIDISPK